MASGAGISYSESMSMDDETLAATILIINEWNDRCSKANN